jgi:hypothetical protein
MVPSRDRPVATKDRRLSGFVVADRMEVSGMASGAKDRRRVAGSHSRSMTAADLLKRLERVRKASDGWLALCPAHADKNPSLSVGVGDSGQILLRCFAGCPLDAILRALALEIGDLFAEPRDRRGAVVPASAVPVAARWLREVRRLPEPEIGRVFAWDAAPGPAIVFRYLDGQGKLLYEKYRAIETKRFWRRPAGSPSALYGLSSLDSGDPERVVVVEGELDAHALGAAGIAPVVSVPDGCGSKLTPELLAPLAPFREVIIAADADPAGDAFAQKLARALGEERCLRLRFILQGGGKDANDALRAGWSAADFAAAIATATPMAAEQAPSRGPAAGTEAEGEPSAGGDEPALLPKRYQVVDGCICYLRRDRNGNDVVEYLANFDARIEEEVTRDDGAERTREFALGGKLADGAPLPRALVPARDFGGLGWVCHAWGARAVVSAGAGAKDHLRAAIQKLSSPASRTIFRHTGWREIDGRWLYLYQGGAVGGEHIEVDLDPPLDRFALPAIVEDVAGAVAWSLRLLECAPLAITLPLLAGVYLAPVAFILDPDVALWMYGPTGSLKSELATLAQRHFGRFDRKSLPCTWTSTENALEHRLHALKDVLVVIDDFAPQADATSEKEQTRKAQRILRGIGNRASRGRMRSDLTNRPDRPPRGLALCTGETLPPGLSINARTVQIEVDRERLNLPAITALQENGARLAHAVRAFVDWLRPQIPALQGTLPEARENLRRDFQAHAAHLRQPEALANLYLGLDLFLVFAQETGALDQARADRIRDDALTTFEMLAGQLKERLTEMDPAERFVEVLSTLVTQRQVTILDRGSVPRGDGPEAIGWRDADRVLLLHTAAYRRVALFLRDGGEFWNPGARELHQALLRRRQVTPSETSRPDVQWRVGPDGHRVRGWPLAPGVLPPPPASVTTASPLIPGTE